MVGREQNAPAPSAVAAFLSDPASHGGAAVEHVETHSAEIFLAADDAYKLKKPVRFAFLDYSTIEKREAACRAEIVANPGAEAIYRGVRPIRRGADGALFLDKDAPSPFETVDWVVWMRRFDREAGLDRMLEAGKIDRPLIDALADAIAKTHARAAPNAAYGRPADYAKVIEDMRAAVAPIEAAAAETWATRARDALERSARRIDQRRRRGFVRRLHGDLHLGNVVLLNGRPTPFDAIEFSERVATIDRLYDIGFTAADLTARGRGDLANALMNRYLGATRDYGGLSLWPFFVSLRLAVRAMAAAFGGAPEEARARIALADQILAAAATAPPGRLIAVGGLSGSGKTTLARGLAAALRPPLGAAHLSSDAIRKRLYGAPPERRLPEAAYAPAVSGLVHRRMFRDARRALLSGADVVLDATFTDARARTGAADAARRIGRRFDGVWLETDVDTRAMRIRERRGDASDISPTRARRQKTPEISAEWITLRSDAAPEAAHAAALAYFASTPAGLTRADADESGTIAADAPKRPRRTEMEGD